MKEELINSRNNSRNMIKRSYMKNKNQRSKYLKAKNNFLKMLLPPT